jgi:GT2 family glycosyltransferase
MKSIEGPQLALAEHLNGTEGYNRSSCSRTKLEQIVMNEPSLAPEISIIIVNWNSKLFLRQCLTSLYSRCRSVPFDVVVVDGGSFDGCAEMLVKEFPAVVFIQCQTNVGFAKANNLGVSRARGRYLLFLNPDTELLEDSIHVLQKQLDLLPGSGAMGCKLLNSDGSLQINCVQAFPTVFNQIIDSEFLRRRFPAWKTWGMGALFANPPQPMVVEVIVGACLLVKREAFDAVGGFSERYFMYGEDADFCFKVRQAGYRVYYVPDTNMIHHGGTSSKQAKNNFSNVMLRESIYRFLKSNHSCIGAYTYRIAIVLASVVRLFLILILLPVSRKEIVCHKSGSLQKWLSILRWGVGLESWVRTVPPL